jgi:hypothetical protein
MTDSHPLSGLILNRDFEKFEGALQDLCRRLGLKYEVTYCEPTANAALRLDFDSVEAIGRVTAWVSGACDLEVLEVASGQTVLWEHHEVASSEDFQLLYPKVPEFMKLLSKSAAG